MVMSATRRNNVILAVIVVCLAAMQASFAYSILRVVPKRDYLAPVPSPDAQDAMAFGDREFLHRMFALEVQEAGDTGGRIVPVKYYDFSRVVGWLEVLERLDVRSEFAIGMGYGYFGLSQDVRNVEPIVRFMMRDVAIDPAHKWRWLIGAVYLARHRLKDDRLALEAAQQLAACADVDAWGSMIPAFILEDSHDYKAAAEVVRETVRRFGPQLSEKDARWTASYLEFLAKVDAGLVPPRRPSVH